MEQNDYHQKVPNSVEFEAQRRAIIRKQSQSDRAPLSGLLTSVIENRFEYQWTWLGVPIIRLPEDLMVQQEIMETNDFGAVIETGVARGGGLIFSASVLQLLGSKSPVIGVDNVVHPHTWAALSRSSLSGKIRLVIGDSSDQKTVKEVERQLTTPSKPTLVVLDSDHSPEHVLGELRQLSKICAVGSTIIVCDTIIDEVGPGLFPGRSWNDGVGPYSAVRTFLGEAPDWRPSSFHGRRGIISEIRDGVLEKFV